MNRILVTIVLLTNLLVFAQKKETIKIPTGVVYNYCEPRVIDEAKRLINEDISNNDSYKLCDKLLIIGPELWKRYRNVNLLKDIDGGQVKILCDGEELEAKISQDKEDSKKIWTALREEIRGKEFNIRKLNEKELKYFWSVISFDIDEPLLVLETSEHRYILNILQNGLKVMWLDEAP
jgi:hypothetical protein